MSSVFFKYQLKILPYLANFCVCIWGISEFPCDRRTYYWTGLCVHEDQTIRCV